MCINKCSICINKCNLLIIIFLYERFFCGNFFNFWVMIINKFVFNIGYKVRYRCV